MDQDLIRVLTRFDHRDREDNYKFCMNRKLTWEDFERHGLNSKIIENFYRYKKLFQLQNYMVENFRSRDLPRLNIPPHKHLYSIYKRRSLRDLLVYLYHDDLVVVGDKDLYFFINYDFENFDYLDFLISYYFKNKPNYLDKIRFDYGLNMAKNYKKRR